MRVRVAAGARRQIEAVLDHISAVSPGGAVRVRNRITEITAVLQEHPLAGRVTSRRGVRRFALNPFPYLLFYRVTQHEIIILRFRHGARRDIDLEDRRERLPRTKSP